MILRGIPCILLALALGCGAASAASGAVSWNVRDFGAKGDGVTLDSAAINSAIDAAAAAGGGTVQFAAGRYLSFSIRLKSNITLQLDSGCVLVAANPASGAGRYDPAEPNQWDQHQDFGHSHWQNSLISGIGLENVAIVGGGLIDGTKGLSRNGPRGRRQQVAEGLAAATPAADAGTTPRPREQQRQMEGLGNKAIGLKNCRNVTLRDFSVLNGGHFALLATGIDNLTIDNLRVDTNRDGFDLDACRNVRLLNCSVNAPNDDAIVLKSSFALGEARATENVTISNCFVSGFDVGSMLDGTWKRTLTRAPDGDGPTGRIKFGTESNGGFKNIAINNCVFERSRGLALENVDGGAMEDIVISNIVMRDISNSPIFLRLGHRARGPESREDTPVGAIRRVKISQVTVNGADGRFPILIAGLAGHPIEDVTLENIHVLSRGGITMEQVAQQPAELVNTFFQRGSEAGATGPRDPFAVPERERGYPEPSMFGLLPASALYARHVSGLTLRDVTYKFEQPGNRPSVVLDDVNDACLTQFHAPAPPKGSFILRNVRAFESYRCRGVEDLTKEAVENLSL